MDPITWIIVQLVIAVASTLIAQALAEDQKPPTPGVRGNTSMGGDHPLSFIMGRYMTAGIRVYPRMTWGGGDVPNSNLVDVIAVSCLPVRGLAGLYVNGERVTLLTGEEHPDKGYPVEEYRDDDDKDHLWIRFYDGTQTEADAYLIDKFGDHDDYPWEADMIGRGVAYAICTARVERELFPGFPEYRFEIDGIEMDDPRGDDEQENPVVGIRTVLKGIYYDGQWVYGPQKVTDYQLPSANWEAQMDKCDALVTLADASTEKRCRFGFEVTVDTEPHVIIGEYLKGCNGRIAEIGGLYKILVGEPDAAVASFTDEDIIVTEGQSYEPFPGLEATHNAFTATYPEPAEAWEMKEAPPLYSDVLEGEDDDRRLSVSTEFKAVPHAIQVQRLMQAMQLESRRFRRHSHTMPPSWWEYEPLDAVEWTSTRNGYEDKLFLVTAIEDRGDTYQVVGLQEQEPEDYDWDAGDQVPVTFTPVVPVRPAPQGAEDFSVTAATIFDSQARARRPAILCEVGADLDDVMGVRIEVRLASDQTVIHSSVKGYDATDPAPVYRIAGDGILPATGYEARGRYLPFGPRATQWSDWLAVTTPDLPVQAIDLGLDVRQFMANAQSQIDELRQAVALGFTESMNTHGNALFWRQALRNRVGATEALVALQGTTFADGIEANAELIGVVQALAQQGTASGLFKIEAEAGPTGVEVRFGVYLKTETTDYDAEAAMFLDILEGGGTRFVVAADRVAFLDSGGDPLALLDEDGFLVPGRIDAQTISADMIIDNSITGNAVAQLANTDTTWAGGGGVWVDVVDGGGSDLEVTIDVADGAFVEVDFIATLSHGTAESELSTRVLRDGSEIITNLNFSMWDATSDGGMRSTVPFKIIDTPSAGNHTYKAQWQASVSAGVMKGRVLVVKQFRK